ncbi:MULTISPECIES: tyrosine-type recombinase/integrase [Brenneria]|uniref:Integrase n=1 Tax=Brenneria nigrifluens DSM 30175 = ATCC 13028 TaxID=1121120 RepID=A0A2U1UVZ0_9GAMM|nr:MULTISPECIES: tyrosine-type recombinase/integrase [Brenneria]EHD22800.1 integrase family protein [Brenneria sp. EniD312]PWC25845.1 integrase [Brenneria nigrifluens] [Brenneria nigrifluens DSM 30175 = ATCC 13028]QCR05771.1 integrase [Brenneria nigrifluens] [Brenneria nigrifluens DSM 30175 = ATCC 13028]
MLEHYFRSFKTIDHIQALWLGPQIERYAQWLHERHTSHGSARQHVRALGHFNNFVIARGVSRLEELPDHVEAFVAYWKSSHSGWCKSAQDRAIVVTQSRVPVERMLCLALPDYSRPDNRPDMPFAASVPGFFPFLLNEKGLRQATLHGYTYTLRPFEAYLERGGVILSALMPADINGFIEERARTLHKSGMLNSACALRVFLRYLYREGILSIDLVHCVPRGRVYRQASLPRAIGWTDVERLLLSIDRRSELGKRDYAILTLLASYGLRAREIVALSLDDFDWIHNQISIPMRKGGHSTRYPLSATVGEAVIDYLQVRRADVDHRQVFLTVKSPYTPIQHWRVSSMTGDRMRDIGIPVARAGSHTLRHACVQHLVEAGLPFKTIGDYVGHRDPASTLVYGKVAVHKLREIVTGQGEEML